MTENTWDGHISFVTACPRARIGQVFECRTLFCFVSFICYFSDFFIRFVKEVLEFPQY